MTEQRVTWDRLNAYVDGEVDPPLAAEIAAAAAADPKLAETIATLSRLKAASAEALAPDPLEVPEIRMAQRGSARQAWRRASGQKWAPRRGALAASLAFAAFLGGSAWYLLYPHDPAEDWLAAAEARHAQWIAARDESDAGEGLGGSDGGFAEVSIADARGYLPDLSPAHLRLAHVSDEGGAAGESLFVGYLGRNGCRLGLWIGAAPRNLPVDLTFGQEKTLTLSATWTVGETGYAAVAESMDEDRFLAVARYLEQATRQAAEGRETIRMAARLPGTERPCQA